MAAAYHLSVVCTPTDHSAPWSAVCCQISERVSEPLLVQPHIRGSLTANASINDGILDHIVIETCAKQDDMAEALRR